ncbi:MAG TPA: serine hydrolase domain-containing protein [Thermomicrobiales bacterium]|nr:serine hydrolase domain-containing protein [Thermomicrobiales bacterium]
MRTNPNGLGFDTNALDRAWISLVEGAQQHEYGGAVALIARHGQIVLHRATGWAVREPADQRSVMGVDEIFDLASLTKVTATLPAILQLVAAGRLELDQPVGEILPEFGTEGAKAGVTIRRLLTHSAGLSDWRPVFLDGMGADAYLADFAATQPEHTPGAQVIYSDPSFITLGEVVRRLTGESIAEYARREIFQPLGMTDTMFTPPAVLRSRIAATEVGNDFEAAKVPGREPVMTGGWRQRLLRGEVHDGNAWYGFEGVTGHAGLFGTALDLARYGTMWLNGGELDGVRVLPESIVREARTNQIAIEGVTERRGLGWRMLPVPGTPEATPDSGRGLSQNAFGHTGFTGTSLWMEPEHDLVIVLLTNRVHPVVTTTYMERRAAFTEAVVGALR